jgi:lysophospholipase L1-like esterase
LVPNAAQAASFADDIQYAQSVAIVRANHNDTAVTDVSRRYAAFDWGDPTNNSCMHLSASYALRTAEAVSLYKRYPDSKLNGMQYFDTVQIIWTTAADPVSQITFEDALGPYGFKQLLASQTYMVQLQIDTDGRLVVRDCSEPPYSSSPAIWFADGRQIMQLVYAHGYNIQYPIDFVGIPVPTKVPNARYVAMGDSFSSGEGNPPFEPGTDTSDNKCHRSSQAYPRLLQNDPDLNLGSMAFVACSGAKTSDVLYSGSCEGNWVESAQTSVLSADTETVTITIGGNDVGFVGYAKNCVLSEIFPLVTLYQSYGGCGSGTAAYTAVMANVNSITFLNKLQLTYNAVLESAPNAKVYVVDYPLIFGDQNDPYSCSIADGSGAYAVETALNATISDAVQAVRSYNSDYADRLMYVNTNESSSPFTDEYICAEGINGSAFRGVTLPSTELQSSPKCERPSKLHTNTERTSRLRKYR